MRYLDRGLAEMGLGKLGKVLSIAFAVMCVGGSFGGGNMFQANQSCAQIGAVVPLFAGSSGKLVYGIVLALLFVTLPFVVRAVEPVLAELDPAEEEASITLGAGRWTTFRRVLLPPIRPAVAAGVVQTCGRSVAEFGSLAAVSGNIPHQTLVAPVYILGEVEAGNPGGAAAVSVILLALALVLQPLSAHLASRAGGTRG